MFSCWGSENRKLSLDLRARNQNSLPATQLGWFVGYNVNHGSQARPSAWTAIIFREGVVGPVLIRCSWNQKHNYKITKRNYFVLRNSVLGN